MRAPFAIAALCCAYAQQQTPPDDPFAGVTAAPVPATAEPRQGGFFRTNFGFRTEVMSQFTVSAAEKTASRQSVGFEVLKKFSSATATFASFNFQGRMVRRDRFQAISNDMEGATRPGWTFEYHNAYLDLYNVFGSRHPGRFHLRAGRFYLPFGLNLQTDTHGTVLQLSNDRNFGFERDWYTGLYGMLNRHLNYDAYYMAGSGYGLRFQGQRGLAAVRVSLANRYANRYGLEGGVAVLTGERLNMAHMHGRAVETRRAGGDARLRRAVPSGTLTLTTELSRGTDNGLPVNMQLHQAEYLHASRRWGFATQYRRFQAGSPEASLLTEFTWYFRNDVANSSLHWVKFHVDHRLQPAKPRTVFALQYYFYR